jgi:hypothetical protein
MQDDAAGPAVQRVFRVGLWSPAHAQPMRTCFNFFSSFRLPPGELYVVKRSESLFIPLTGSWRHALFPVPITGSQLAGHDAQTVAVT